MQSIIIWGRQIFIVCIISNIFIRLVPSQKYEKYIKYICGIILLVICITPVLELFNSSFSFSQIYEKFQNGSSMKQLKNELKYTSTAGSAMLDSYIAKVEKDVDTFTLEEGLYPVSTQVIIDEDEQSDSFGNIQDMKLVVSMAKDSEDTYKNTKDNISIEIEKIRIKEKDVIKDNTVTQQISDLKRKLSEMYNISEDVIDIAYE